ncbi:hypothetical protein GCM10027598_70510 [Amycolatopsis oliviviridis]|uniref:Uncharacterized protein n=1 Tax=Amycolatopsis oliviviridis TaxID=1471590 RepID=A0ABQ3L2U4_9PSEU|nr:hypothetical protein [Amycolatopsis oliviviridis]GHH00887.1 hypothetical protein GCM10017790_00430 [Amycolatopsis oliviviridis]
MTNEFNTTIDEMPWNELKPFMSVIVLQCVGDPALAFGALVRLLKKPGRARQGTTVRTVAESELSLASDEVVPGVGSLESLRVDQLFGSVRQQQSRPGWVLATSDYFNVSHELLVALRRDELIAVRADRTVLDRLQKELDKTPRPPLRRLASGVLEEAFMQGAAKNIWMRSIQRRSTLRPASKAIGGDNLGVALDPVEDAFFAWDAARCEMPDSPEVVYLKGKVGVTVSNSQIWFKDSPDFHTYVLTMGEILGITAEVIEAPTGFSAFPVTAREVFDLTEVSEAYEVLPLDLDSLPESLRGGDEIEDAAVLLERAVLSVQEGARGTKFKLDVGTDGVIGGQLAASLTRLDDRFELDVGFDRNAREPLPAAREVCAALNTGQLLEVYFASGHKYSSGRLWKEDYSPTPFSGWAWEDFAGFDITKEKPKRLQSTTQIHAAIAEAGDDSLFAWMVEYCSEGWLICDDSSGEAADFFHIDEENLLRVFHVKASSNGAATRGVKVIDYDVVLAQAQKNMLYLDKERLASRLASTNLKAPACWFDGVRVDDRRQGFLSKLKASRAKGTTEVVVVQPNLSRTLYDKLSEDIADGVVSQNTLRLQLLEMQLKMARIAAVKYVTDLTVIGSG